MEAGGVEPLDLLVISITYKAFGVKMAKTRNKKLKKIDLKLIEKLTHGDLNRAVDMIILADEGYLYNPNTNDFELPSLPTGDNNPAISTELPESRARILGAC